MNQGPISHWPNTCWNFQESSSWCVEETNVLTLFVVQLASFLPPSTTEILCHEPYTVLALSEKPGQKAAFHRGEDLSVRISASWHTAAGQAHSGQQQFWAIFFPLVFFLLWAIAFMQAYFTSIQLSPCPPSIVFSPLESKHNLEIGQYWEVQMQTGQFTAGWSWHSSSQGILVPTIAMGSTSRRHRVFSHIILAVHTVNPVLPNVPDTLAAATHPPKGSIGCRARLEKAVPYRPSLI